MKNFVIGTLGGGIIIFFWSAISWMILPIHSNTYKYHSHQEELMVQLEKFQTEDGVYVLPTADDRKISRSSEAYQNAEVLLKQASLNKPWMILIYLNHKESMTFITLAKGFLYDLFIAFAFCFALSRIGPGVSYASRFMVCLIIGMAFIFQGPLRYVNWQGYPLSFFIGEIIDTLVEVALVGGFISWIFGPDCNKMECLS